MNAAAGYDGIAIVAPWSEPYVRFSDHGAIWFLGRALAGALARAGLAPGDVDGLSVTSMSLAPDTSPAVVDHLGLSPRWLNAVPFGGASGLIALQRAARAVQAGDASIVACIAGDTMRKGGFAEAIGRFSSFSMDAAHPYGAGGPNTVFALITQSYMQAYGATREDFARMCVAQRAHARENPQALLRDELSLQACLDARPIVEPLHLFDCVMPCAGGEAFLVMREDEASRRGLAHARLRGYIEHHNACPEDPVQLRAGWHAGRERLYAQADSRPGEMDFVQTYDDYPVISFLQLEGLGLCEPGTAAQFFTDGERIPHNTGGGQLSCGQAGYAGGFVGIVEAVRQLTREPLGAQVAEATRGLVGGFGFVNYDRGICTSAAILERGA